MFTRVQKELRFKMFVASTVGRRSAIVVASAANRAVVVSSSPRFHVCAVLYLSLFEEGMHIVIVIWLINQHTSKEEIMTPIVPAVG